MKRGKEKNPTVNGTYKKTGQKKKSIKKKYPYKDRSLS